MIPREMMLCSVAVIACALLSGAGASPSLLGEAIGEHLKDVSHSDEAEALKVENRKGEKVKHLETGVTDNSKTQYSDAKDEGHYLKKNSDTKAHDESDSYKGHNSKQDKMEDNERIGFKKGHKKGHHNQGFQNSYHKDESSNKSTFFDEFNDEADQAKFNNRVNSYDNQGGRDYRGSNRDGNEFVRRNYNSGRHNSHGDVGNKQVGHKDFDNKYYKDDLYDYNKRHKGHAARDRGQHYGRDHHGLPHHAHHGLPDHAHHGLPDHAHHGLARGSDDWNDGFGGPGFYGNDGFRREGGYGRGPDHGYGYDLGRDYTQESRADLAPVARPALDRARDEGSPIVAHRQQTITIYEDPRYDGSDKGQLRRASDAHLQLEVRPSGQRYATYDDTYYAPRRDGRVETSKVNHLVYNYRRE